MKKLFMNNIINFVDSNVRQRIDRANNNNNDFFDQDLLVVERQFEDLKQFCVEAEKRISSLLLSIGSQQYPSSIANNLTSLTSNTSASHDILAPNQASVSPNPDAPVANSPLCSSPVAGASAQSISTQHNNSSVAKSSSQQKASSSLEIAQFLGQDDIRRHKRLPVVSFLKFLVKSQRRLRPDSLLASTLTHSSQLQQQLTKLYIAHEQTIETHCLKPIQHLLEIDAPNVIKLRKLFIKSHNDLESLKAKYNGASQKQQQQHLQLQAGHFTSTSYTLIQAANSAQQANINKLDHLKKELDEAQSKFEQARDSYATELYVFVCREAELVELLAKLYRFQADYHQQVYSITQSSLPALTNLMTLTPRKPVFGIPLEDHLNCIGRKLSLVIEICIHFLYSNSLSEEGLFRIPGSSAKIKKLRSAINAWFITLSNQDELECESQRYGANRALHAIYDLVKLTVIQDAQDFNSSLASESAGTPNTIPNHTNSTVTTKDEHANSSGQIYYSATNAQTDQTEHSTYFDPHTVAGLLKLYLRELPEPLLTYRLYAQWIDTTLRITTNVKDENYVDKSVIELKEVIQQLPKAHYDNIQHLIRFLNLLTGHSDSNKMTATNLAITMAPSLIRAPPVSRCESAIGTDSPLPPQTQKTASNDINLPHHQNDLHAMSSIGISASLHASLIESLIRLSDRLFPGQQQFQMPELLSRGEYPSYPGEHILKSSSPGTLSTASTSSFSSGSITSSSTTEQQPESAQNKGDGSVELISSISDDQKSKIDQYVCRISPDERPKSIHFQNQYDSSNLVHNKGSSPPVQPATAPPVPPAPAARSGVKHAIDLSSVTQLGRNASTQNRHQSMSIGQKPPAPPPPPQPSTIRRSQNVPTSKITPTPDVQQVKSNSSKDEGTCELKSAEAPTATSNEKTQSSATGPVSLRGTGTASSAVVRPSVPPPNRPESSSSAV